MAEEEVVVELPATTDAVTATSPVTTDHKRKLQDLEAEEATETVEAEAKLTDADNIYDEVADGESPDSKRLRLDENKSDGLASENGFGKEESKEEEEEEGGDGEGQGVKSGEEHSDSVTDTVGKEEQNVSGDDDSKSVSSIEDSKNGPVEKNEEEQQQEEEEEKSIAARFPEEEPESDDTQTTSHKMEVPNDKVGVLIGKRGDTIRYLQYNSGAKIQITRDMDADPHSTKRPVEIIGTLSSISMAEKLINAVIAEADAGGSPSLVARGLPSAETTGSRDQIEMLVPNEKVVGLIIGRGGDTIKALQAKSGARIQLIPQHLPEGDGSKERTVRVTGDRRQIEMAREMIKDVMDQNVRLSPPSGGYKQQQSYRPRGPSGPSHWGPRGPHSSQPSHYDYHHRPPYPSPNMQYPPPNYGGYPPQHIGPRGSFGPAWEQRPPNMPGPASHGGGYDYYSGQGGHVSDHSSSAPVPTPMSAHAPGPSPTPGMGHPPSQANYNYGQPHGPDYGHQAPYSQTVPQQGYGHGYDEPKYDNHAQTQYPYGHGNSQPVYPQASSQPGYGAQQQYGKQTSYGMPSQGPPQSYGPPRPGQPGDMPYQAPIQSSQSYGSNVPPQQQYPYASSGPMQQSYPSYGATSAADGYNQGLPASGPGYPQQSGQSVPSYGQPGGQQAAPYVQGQPGGYGSYPSQQAYPEQPAQNNAGYGYQGSQDSTYSAGTGSAYATPASGQQGYVQPTPTQPSYDQSVPQSGAYATAPAPVSATVSYAKTVSPKPGYPQYDSSQMYVTPR